MTLASIRAAAEHIARVGAITPHQLAALTALDQQLTPEQRQAFTDLWRAQGSPAAPPPPPAEPSRAAELALFVGQQLQQQIPQATGRVTPRSPFTALLTPHIRVGEFALDQEARRFHHQHQIDTAAELAAFLERVRQQFGGRPIVITSGYRPPAINRSVGGASGSEHLFDAPGVGAVDFYVAGSNITNVQHWCDREWPYSLGYGAPKGFVHLGIRRGRPRLRWPY
jgi:hypothetical protein